MLLYNKLERKGSWNYCGNEQWIRCPAGVFSGRIITYDPISVILLGVEEYKWLQVSLFHPPPGCNVIVIQYQRSTRWVIMWVICSVFSNITGRGEEKWHSVPRVAIKQGTVRVISFSKTYKNLSQANSGFGDETCAYIQFQPAATLQ